MKITNRLFSSSGKRPPGDLMVQMILLGLTGLVLSSCLGNGFVPWDDPGHLLKNPLVRNLNLENVREIFTTTVNGTYIPLTMLTFSLEYSLVEYAPFIYHLDNLLLHLAVTALVFAFARKLGLSLFAAFVGGLLFGIHPMHVEAVAWVTARKDVLYALFYLLALLAYQRYLEKGMISGYVLTMFFGFLSLLAKPMALSLPLVLILCDWFNGRKLTLKSLLEKTPFFMIAISVSWITYAVNARIPTQNPSEAGLIWIWTLMFYLKKFFMPVVLSPLYQLPEPASLYHLSYGLSVGAFLAAVFFLVKFRRNRWLIFSFFYYLVSIFFLLRYDNVVDKSIVADRYMYLPSLGFCLMLGAVLDRVARNIKDERKPVKQFIYGLVIIIFSVLGVKAHAQAKVWNNGVSLWTEVIKHYPDETSAYNNRGVTYHDQGRYQLALKDFHKAAALNPREGRTYLNRGVTYARIKQFDLAHAEYKKALGLMPEDPEIYNNRGALFLKQRLYAEALDDFNRAIGLDPGFAEAYNNRGKIYSVRKQYGLSIADYTKAISLDSRLATAYNNRGADHYEQKRYEPALSDFTQAIAIDPRYTAALMNRANAFIVSGRPWQGIEDLRKILDIEPTSEDAHYYMAIAHINLQDYPQALADLNRLLAINPDHRGGISTREFVRKKMGIFEEP